MRRMLSLGMVSSGGSLALAGASAGAGPSLLFDAKTGQVIESDNPFQRWYPASLTKLMTTYVAFRAVQAGEVTLASPVRISKNAANEPPSKMGYQPGSVLTLDNALKIIMVKSANDVATVDRRKPRRLAGGLRGAHERRSAAARHDRLALGQRARPARRQPVHDGARPRHPGLGAAPRFPAICQLFLDRGPLRRQARSSRATTMLIGRFDGADGMKTGYTCPSGFNLVASATRNGRTLMAVVVGADVGRVARRGGRRPAGARLSPPTAGGPTLGALQPSGAGIDQATNMHDAALHQGGQRAALRKKERGTAASARSQGEDEPASYLASAKKSRI